MPDKEFQLGIEKLFNNNQTVPRLKKEFKDSDLLKHMLDNGIPEDFGLTLLAQMALHKRANMQTMIGIMRRFFIESHGSGASQACADALLYCAQIDLMDWHPVRREFILRWDVNQSVKDDIEMYQYPLPMVIPPKELKTNTDSGYLTGTGSLILKGNHHEDDICLDHLNVANSIKLRINSDVVNMIQNSWKGIDKPKTNESYEEYQKRVRAFEKYDRTSRDVMVMLEVAGNEFYLTHKYDKRGRTYCQGYHVNYQGNPWNKAVVELVTEEVPNA